jgi:hypothetical protein
MTDFTVAEKQCGLCCNKSYCGTSTEDANLLGENMKTLMKETKIFAVI